MDAGIIKLVVGILGVIGLVCTCGMVGLSWTGREPPSALISVASSAVGALVGILAAQGSRTR